MSGSASHRLCHWQEIPDGQARGFDPLGQGRDTVFVVRRGPMLRAWLDRCPHEGDTPLPLRRHHYLNAQGSRIVCFAHGAQFDLATGQGVTGPCVGQALRPLPLHIGADGAVQATLPCPGGAGACQTQPKHQETRA